MEIRKSALIGHSAVATFDLIEAAEHYPEFLPLCSNVVILARDASLVMARITISYRGLKFDLTTRNPKRPPHWMAIHGIDLEGGPFRLFEGEWQVVELSAEACRIEFTLRCEFKLALLNRLARVVSPGVADTMFNAFAHRAAQMLVAQGQSNHPRSFQTPGTTAIPIEPADAGPEK